MHSLRCRSRIASATVIGPCGVLPTNHSFHYRDAGKFIAFVSFDEFSAMMTGHLVALIRYCVKKSPEIPGGLRCAMIRMSEP